MLKRSLFLCFLPSLFLLLSACQNDGSRKTRAQETELATNPSLEKIRRDRGRSVRNPRSHGTSASANPKAASQHPTTTIMGNVVKADGSPAGGAALTLWTLKEDANTTLTWIPVATTSSTPQGYYKIETTTTAALAVTARKAGFAIAVSSILPEKSSSRNPAVYQENLYLRPGTQLSGRVVQADGTPVSGATVLGCPADLPGVAIGEFITKTDSTGCYTLTAAPPGAFPIAVFTPDGNIHLFESAAPVESQELMLSAEPVLLDGQIVSPEQDITGTTFTLKLALTSPIEGLNLSRTLVAGADGTFDFRQIPTESAILSLQSDPARFQILSRYGLVNQRPALYLQLEDGKSTTVQLEVTAGKTVAGRVLEERTSSPIASAKVFRDRQFSEESTGFSLTNAAGEFSLENVADPARLLATSDEFFMLNRTAEKIDDLCDTVTLLMQRKPWVRGRVQDENDNPVPGATLRVFDYAAKEKHVPLESDGTFQTALAPGTYKLIAEVPSKPLAYAEIEVAQADVNDILLQIEPGRRLTGKVVNATDEPVPGAVVRAQPGRPSAAFGWMESLIPNQANSVGSVIQALSTENGSFVFEGLPRSAGVALTAHHPDYADSELSYVEPGLENAEELRLVFPLSGSLRGHVQDQGGQPVVGAICELTNGYARNAYSVTGATDTTGSFHLAPISTSATLLLQVKAAGYDLYRSDVRPSDDLLSVTLARTTNQKILIHCVDVSTGEGVEAAVITFLDVEPVTADPVKGKPGTFELTLLSNTDSGVIAATAKGYLDTESYMLGGADRPAELTLQMRPSGRVKGRVITQDGAPAPDAVIRSLSNKDKATPVDAAGRFEFEIKETRAKYLAALPAGATSDVFHPNVAANAVSDIGDIMIRPDEPLVVRTVKSATGEPVSGVQVNVSASGRDQHSGQTDANGELRFILKPTARQYNYISIELPDNAVTRLVEIRKAVGAPIIIPLGDASLSGYLLLDNKPVAGSLSLYSLSANSQRSKISASTAKGFQIDNLPAGEWVINALLVGKDVFSGSTSMHVTLAAGEHLAQDIHLERQELTGVVVNEDNTAVANAMVFYYKTDGNGSGNLRADVSGQFRIPGSSPGTYRLQAETRDKRSDYVVYQWTGTAEEAPARLVAKPFTGRIVCTALSVLDGLPILQAFATLSGAHGGDFEGKQDGFQVVLDKVPPGEYQLTVGASGFSQSQRYVTVGEEETLEFTDVLSPAADLSVTVLDEKGYLQSGVQISLTPTQANSSLDARQGVTNQSGNAHIGGLLAGTYRVMATSPDGATATATVSTANKSLEYVTLVLASRGS